MEAICFDVVSMASPRQPLNQYKFAQLYFIKGTATSGFRFNGLPRCGRGDHLPPNTGAGVSLESRIRNFCSIWPRVLRPRVLRIYSLLQQRIYSAFVLRGPRHLSVLGQSTPRRLDGTSPNKLLDFNKVGKVYRDMPRYYRDCNT